MELTIDQALQKGVAAHKEGKLQNAERLYRAILQAQPKHPDANHNLGVLAVAVGKLLESLPLFQLALEVNPKIDQFWLSYVDALIRLERFEEARRAIVEGEKSGVSSEKLDVLKQRLQANVINDTNETEKGQTLSEKRKRLATKKKGKKRKVQGDSASGAPSQDQINRLLGHYQAGRLVEAETLARLLTQQFPSHPFAWKVLGVVLQQTGGLAESLLPLQAAVKLSQQDAEAHYNLGNTLKKLNRLSESKASYERAIVLKPDHAEAHNNLGNTLKKLGRLAESEASYRQAIALKPDFAEAYYNLATTRKFSSEDEQILQMLALYRDLAIPEENRCHICFALANAFEGMEDFAAAFQFYAEGNALRKKQLGYDKAQDKKLFERLKASYPRITAHTFKPEILAPKHAPIFIVGMPRSGTTLVEQIISSHPLVTGAGELHFVSKFGSSLAVGKTPVDGEALRTFREHYLDALQQRSEGKAIVTDKMPRNFRFLALITAALPEAKIIHVKRDPAAVCWANYTKYFVGDGLGYCFDLEDILHYHALYEDLMKLWHQALPFHIYDLDYERLTKDQEQETRKLIDYLGLNWDDACLSPHDNTRGVATASHLQVRRKVYQGSSEKWKRYRPFLHGSLDHLSVGNQ